MKLSTYMKLALEEAKISLREGNNGFGAVIIKNEQIISCAHDTESIKNDPTLHAEMNAIKEAAQILGKSLSGCILVSTHEPCPMCAGAAVWSGISEIAYGCSIQESLMQGRKCVNLTCNEIFKRAGVAIKIHKNILKNECALLYRNDVRAEIEKLRGADDTMLDAYNTDSINRRIKWFQENRKKFEFLSNEPLNSGYKLLLRRFNITQDEAPVIAKSDREVVFHSKNFCPTLEACRILGLDTRTICKKLNENATDILIKQIDPRLAFSRNYDKLRPYAEYCEEIIKIEEKQ